MRALLRKELGEALVPAMCLFVPACFVWLVGANTRDVLMAPQEEITMTVLVCAGVAGLLIGYCQFAAERWRKTLGYVMHRGTNDGQLFIAKIVAGLAVTALIAIGPLIVFTLWHKLTAEDRAILQLQRIVELGWLSTLGVGAYALGVLTSQLQRAWWKEVLFGCAGCIALALLALRLTLVTPDDPTLPAARYVAVQLAIGLVLLVVAFRLFVSRIDRDLPLPNAMHAALALLGIGLFIHPLDCGTAAAAYEPLREVRNEYPLVLRERATGRVLAAGRVSDRGEYVEVDAEGRRLPNAVPFEWMGWRSDHTRYEILYDPSLSGVARSTRRWDSTILNGRWVGLQFLEGGSRMSTVLAANGQFIPTGYLDLHAGVVRVFFNEFDGSRTPVRRPDLVLPRKLPIELVIGKGRSNGRFSGHTVCLEPVREPQDVLMQRVRDNEPPKYHALCAIDLDDRSMWRIDPLDLQTPTREVTLPDGDRFVRLETSQIPGEARPSFFTQMATVDDGHGYRMSYGGTDLVVAGERALYEWTGDRFERFERSPLADGDVELAVQSFNAPGLETAIDPLETSIEVRGADQSQLLFTYDYVPRGPRGQFIVGLIYLASAVRSPVASVVSFFTTVPEGDRRSITGGWLEGPLFFNQHRPLLLVAILALAFVTTKRVIQSLVRRGADGVTIGVWAILTAVFGVYAYLLFRVLEPRGISARSVDAHATSPQPLLIETRARERAHAAGSI
jgi:hypothetical protein